MRKLLTALLALGLLLSAGAVEEVDDSLSISSWYVGASGGMLLPGNGNTLMRAGEVSLRTGCWFGDETLALELEVGGAPNVSTHDGQEALSGVALRHLFRLSGFEFFDKLFGCERFDPFLSVGGSVRFGSRHAFADRSHRTALGPAVGVGAFYHFTDSLALRFDVQAMLGVDSPCGMLYSVGLGLQWTFGGAGE